MNIKLKTPIKVNGKETSEVVIKEDYSAGDMIRIQNAKGKGEGEAFAAVVIAATGWDITTVSQLNSKDFIRINNAAQPFLVDGVE
jgi:hypothetical protein